MKRMLLTVLTKFVELKAILEDFLVLVGVVVDRLTDRTLQFDHVILRHICRDLWQKYSKPGYFRQ